MLFFHSMTAHKGLPNTGRALRISLDTRFQTVRDPINPDSLGPHGKLMTWEDIYADWPDGDLQYYWRKRDLGLAEYDGSYHERRDAMALEMAAAGDANARSALQRIISRDADPAKREKAETLLAALDGGINE